MIMSGWILPDMYEVKCESCSSVNGHLKVVKEYLSNLKAKDFKLYSEVMNEFYKLRLRRKVLDLEDFVVAKLGWVKIINSPIKVVFYSTQSPIEFLVKQYSKLGYTPIPIDDRQYIINVHIPSKELI